jgi:hypothetical protein
VPVVQAHGGPLPYSITSARKEFASEKLPEMPPGAAMSLMDKGLWPRLKKLDAAQTTFSAGHWTENGLGNVITSGAFQSSKYSRL